MTGRLALARLLVAGDRAARLRLLGVIAGVMVGVALFLLLAAASQAFGVRNERSTWKDVYTSTPGYRDLEPGTVLTHEEAAVVAGLDHYGDRTISVVLVATRPDTTFTLPGGTPAPPPGRYVASPALAQVLAEAPADRLADRYGAPAGTLAPLTVEGPDSLVLVRGAEQPEVLAWSGLADPQVVTRLVGTDYASDAYRVVAVVGAVAVLVPVALLVAVVTDLGAAQRAERFAALRLIGATPGTVAGVAALETAATTLPGAVLGTGLYVALVPVAARLEIGTSTFYPTDLLTTPAVVAATVAGVVVGSTAVAWWRARRADLGPLGAQRERSEQPARPVTLLPLGIGVAGLAAAPAASTLPFEVRWPVVVAAFVLTMLGLLWAGPYATAVAARVLAARARTAPGVIGYNRLVQHPRAAFRAVGGLVVAVYAVTVFAVGMTAASGVRPPATGPGYLDPATLVAHPDPALDVATLDAAVARVALIPGVTVVTARHDPGSDPLRVVLTAADARRLGVAAPGSGWVALQPWPGDEAPLPVTVSEAPPDAAATVLLVTAAGGWADVERARTALVTAGLGLTSYPVSRADVAARTSLAPENEFAALAMIGILVAATVSAVSLAVSTVSSLLARRRVLSLLRLVGMPPAAVRATVTRETVLPVATVVLLSIGLGGLTAWSVVTAVSDHRTVSWPGPAYHVVLVGCLSLVGVAVVGSARAARRLASGTVRFE